MEATLLSYETCGCVHSGSVIVTSCVKHAEVWAAAKVDDDGRFVPFEEDPLRQYNISGAVKDNRGKPPIDLLPTKPLLAIAAVLEYGTRKYKPHNWRLGLSWRQTYSSLMRHLLAWNDGEEIDPESGLPHLAHAGCQLMFLLEYAQAGTGEDDRFASIDPSKASLAVDVMKE